MEYSLTAKRTLYSSLDGVDDSDSDAINGYIMYRCENGTVMIRDLELMMSIDSYCTITLFTTVSVLVTNGIASEQIIEVLGNCLDYETHDTLSLLLYDKPIDEIIQYTDSSSGEYIIYPVLIYLYISSQSRYRELLSKMMCVPPEHLFNNLLIEEDVYYIQWQLEIERDLLRLCNKRLEDFDTDLLTDSAKKRREYLMTIDQV